jgi:2-methylcitrate dehydratase
MAEFAVRADVTSLSRTALLQLKIRILDAIGCAFGAFDCDPVRRVRQFVVDFSHDGCCTLIGGDRSAPDRAALYNGALVPVPS